MATYKKRGYKKPKEKVKNGDELINEDGYVEGESTTEAVFENLDSSANRAEDWVAKNQKYIYGILGIVALGIISYMLFTRFVSEPKQVEATNEMYQAKKYFHLALDAQGKVQDSLFNLSLNGGEGKYGFIKVTEEYGGTAAGNMANYYAGTAYLNTGKYQEAINYLDKFDGKGTVLGPIAQGAIGDAFVQLNQLDNALEHYDKAVKMDAEDQFTAPKYLQKAGVVLLSLNNKEKALEYFTRIKENFPDSEEGKEQKIDAYIGKASAGK